MGFLDRFVRQPLAGFARKAWANDVLDIIRSVFGTRTTKSGQNVNALSALDVPTVLACARVLAEGVAQVPLKVYRARAGGKGRDEDPEHPLYDILSRKPNEWQTSFGFRETMMMHLVLCGNFFAFKVYVRGKLAELIPIMPGRVTVKQEDDYRITYKVQAPNGGSSETFTSAQIWHVRGPSWNSWMGLEVVKLAREAIGLALALEEHHARMHSNSARPGGVYSVEGKLDPTEHKKLTKWIADNYTGPENDSKPLIVDRNAKWLDQQPKGVDNQHLETRRYQVEEICRGMRVLPIMVGHADKTATYASAEQMFIAHVMYSLLPWGTRIEQAIAADLLDGSEDRGVSARFNWNGLQRGSFKDRMDAYAKMLGSGGSTPWAEVNEVRDLEEWNPVDWGDGKPEPQTALAASAEDDDTKPKPEPAPAEE